MLLLPLSMCRPGMRLGKAIYSDDGLVLLGERRELTDTMLNRLERFGIHYLYIEDSRTDDLVFQDIVSPETRARAVGEVKSQFRRMMDDSMKKRSVNGLQLGRAFKSIIDSILDDITSSQDAMLMLVNIHASDHYLFQHSVNVCIYSTILGQAYGYTREELFTLGLGALLHDIGKTQLPQDVLLKPSRLTNQEFEIIKSHPMLGFRMLKDEPNVPLLSAHIALQHHERVDGSGYPRAIAGDEIHEYARWVGLVDSYDAMTTHRVYRQAMLPHEAMERLYAGAGTLYDQHKIELFRDKVAIYPLGMIVALDTSEIGVVVDVNALSPQRPVVRIMYDADGRSVTPYEIDLSKSLTTYIKEANVAVADMSA
ncbi:HD-GYP domain-containing protein [Paenibacillus antri]|uniref:HD-GYP domain-containing protein n=1 Tax=Paenibacillus antri TaxID=2582848 RepID=A0A5R9G5L3_9BACL|nr:HD-GYP domain-containing protein [Paenibacillus antri]TLS51071.1 HD-GYP domain-containing protein [Paenibacillus antri]